MIKKLLAIFVLLCGFRGLADTEITVRADYKASGETHYVYREGYTSPVTGRYIQGDSADEGYIYTVVGKAGYKAVVTITYDSYIEENSSKKLQIINGLYSRGDVFRSEVVGDAKGYYRLRSNGWQTSDPGGCTLKCSFTITVTYQCTVPDLAVLSFTSDPSSAVAVGETVKLTVKVQNIMDMSSGACVLSVFDGSTLVQTIPVPALVRHGTFSESLQLTGLSVGDHTFKCVVDAQNSVNELSKDNNVKELSCSIYARERVEVKFDPDCGCGDLVKAVTAGDTIGRLPIPWKRGYAFSGWRNLNGADVSADTLVTASQTLVALWTPIRCELSFDNVGGTGEDSKTVIFGQPLPNVMTPTRYGFAFDGYWSGIDGIGTRYYDADGSSARAWDCDTSQVTLYAKWTNKVMKVKLDSQGGDNGSQAVVAVFGKSMPAIEVPMKKEWAFDGYYSRAEGLGNRYYDNKGNGVRLWDVDESSSVTLYAHWSPVQPYSTVTLDRQGGAGGDSKINARYGTVFPKMTPPSRTGYAFVGYYSEPDGKGTKYVDADGVGVCMWEELSGRTLYADWTPAYRVMLDANYSSSAGMPAVQKECYFTSEPWLLPQKPFSRSGYVFAGWAFEPAGDPIIGDGVSVSKRLFNYGDDPGSSCVTLYAIWGKPFKTDLFPGVSFVTGGQGDSPEWFEENGVLRSPSECSNSWLCATVVNRTTLESAFSGSLWDAAESSHRDFGVDCYAIRSTPSGVVKEFVYRDGAGALEKYHANGFCQTNAFLVPDHLITWVCRKDLALKDWHGYAPTCDLNVLQEIWTINTNALESLSEELYGVYAGNALSSGADGTRQAQLRSVILQTLRAYLKKAIEHRGRWRMSYDCAFESMLRKNLQAAGLNYKWLMDYEDNDLFLYRSDRNLYERLGGTIIADIVAIERFTDGYMKLERLRERRLCSVELVVDDDRGHANAQYVAERIEVLDELLDENEYLLVSFFCSAGCAWGAKREGAERIVVSYMRMSRSGYCPDLYGAINSAFSKAGLRDDWTPAQQEHLHELCDEFVSLNAEMSASKRELEADGVLLWKTVDKGGVVGELPAPEAGCNCFFVGWWTATSGGTRITAATKVNEDIVAYAHWKDRGMVTFVSGTDEKIAPRDIAFGEQLGKLPSLTRSGYAFGGWKYQSTERLANCTDQLEKDEVLLAQWVLMIGWNLPQESAGGWITVVANGKETDYYTVCFESGGGSGTMPDYALSCNAVFALPRVIFMHTKRFAGWQCSNGRRYDDGMLVFNLAKPGETITMTAIWE